MHHLPSRLLILLLLGSLLTAGCSPSPVSPPAADGMKIVVIGKSVHPYWSSVEAGVRAAQRDLNVQTIFFAPPKEDVTAQIQTVETYTAQRVTGIAIAPSDPEALEPFLKKAAAAGILVTTLDTPAVANSASLVYIGTNNRAAGEAAGKLMVEMLPNGGEVSIARGSDTALNSLQRTEGFLSALAGSKIVTLPPYNDREDSAAALDLATSTIAAHPKLAGAFAMYAATGPAWITAIEEANRSGSIKLICFDATTDVIRGVAKGVVAAAIAQREYDMGYKSVQTIKLMTEKGTAAALAEMGAVNGVIDTGVDIVTATNLKQYSASLDAMGIPHDWVAP